MDINENCDCTIVEQIECIIRHPCPQPTSGDHKAYKITMDLHKT